MTRVLRPLALAFGLLACGERIHGQTSAVSGLHTVSIHVNNVETYNALFRLMTEELRWPLLYGRILTSDLGARRNYAGIWVGNVRLEICGPYPAEFTAADPPARWHGLTFKPKDTAEKSVAELQRRGVKHRGPLTWGGTSKFVILDDAALIRPHFSISIMDVADRRADQAENDAAGAKLGSQSVRQVRISYEDDAALAMWRQFLDDAPIFQLVKGSKNGIEAVVLNSPRESPELLDRAYKLGIRFEQLFR
jgi:hypothetical protein